MRLREAVASALHLLVVASFLGVAVFLFFLPSMPLWRSTCIKWLVEQPERFYLLSAIFGVSGCCFLFGFFSINQGRFLRLLMKPHVAIVDTKLLKEVIEECFHSHFPKEVYSADVAVVADTICDEPIQTFPRNTLLASSYDTEKTAQLAQILTSGNCIYFLQADCATIHVEPDQEEPWFGVKYAVQPISDEQLQAWAQAPVHPNIRMASPNPFIPSHFDSVPQADDPPTPIPLLINQDESGEAYYSRISEFNAPQSAFYLHILTPQINSTARNRSLADLYLSALNERLHSTLSAAEAAGLSATLSIDQNQLQCAIYGFSDKAPLFLQEILKQMAVPPPTPLQFERYQEQLIQNLSNRSKNLAVIQAIDLASTVIRQGTPTKQQELDALKTISYDEFCDYLHHIFDQAYVKAMFCGNLSLKEAESSWLDIRHLLSKAPYPKETHPQKKILALSDSQGPFAIHEHTDVHGNAALLLLDMGHFSFERRAAQEILSAVLKEAFFDTLRSKQKTGYIARAQQQEIELRLFQLFYVQSNSHLPDDLLYRFEQFLESFTDDIAEIIPASRFATLKKTLAESLLTRYRSLQEKSALWNLLAFDYNGDFQWIEKRLEGYANLSYETFLKEAKASLSRDNHKRLAILFEGRIDSSFAYESVSAADIGNNCEYLTRSDWMQKFQTLSQDSEKTDTEEAQTTAPVE